jgi:hypothetical protein
VLRCHSNAGVCFSIAVFFFSSLEFAAREDRRTYLCTADRAQNLFEFLQANLEISTEKVLRRSLSPSLLGHETPDSHTSVLILAAVDGTDGSTAREGGRDRNRNACELYEGNSARTHSISRALHIGILPLNHGIVYFLCFPLISLPVP